MWTYNVGQGTYETQLFPGVHTAPLVCTPTYVLTVIPPTSIFYADYPSRSIKGYTNTNSDMGTYTIRIEQHATDG